MRVSDGGVGGDDLAAQDDANYPAASAAEPVRQIISGWKRYEPRSL